MKNLKAGAIAFRWNDSGELVRGAVCGPIDDLPGRWRVEVARNKFERWHQLTMLRVVETEAEAAGVSALVAGAELAIRIAVQMEMVDSDQARRLTDRAVELALNSNPPR